MKSVIVGCGTIAEVHAKCLKMLKNCQLAAFADSKKERAEDFAERYGGKAYESLDEMLQCEKPDVLHICTPHYLHVPMAVAALKAGIHVFMEKPPVISYEQLAELKKAAENSEAKLGLCYQNRYNESIRMAKELIDSGAAGRIKGVRGIVTWSRDEKYYTDSDWRGTWATEGGGALINQSIHTLDLIQYLLGSPLWVEASMSNHHLKGLIEVEDTVEAFVCFEKANACFYATTAYCVSVPPLIEVECENVRIRVEGAKVIFYYKDGEEERPEIAPRPALGKGYWGNSHGLCIADFYACAENGTHFRLELSDMEESIRLMLAIYESAKTGTSKTL